MLYINVEMHHVSERENSILEKNINSYHIILNFLKNEKFQQYFCCCGGWGWENCLGTIVELFKNESRNKLIRRVN